MGGDAMSNPQQTSRAAVFSGAGKPLELHAFATPSPQAGEALVAIELCTICGSDLHTIEGKRNEPTPSILGHEILGRVLEVGTPPPRSVDGTVLQPGDRVTWSTCISCGSCDRCVSGLPQKCVRIAKYGHERAEGRQALSGGMADRILLRDGSAIVRLDDGLPDAVACPVNCATATIAAAYRAAGDCRGRRVLVIGAGMLGLTAVAYAKHRGAEQVTICDLDDQRLQRAVRFGADRCVNVAAEAVTESNLGTFDRIIECSGSADAIESALPLGDIGCRFVLVGSVMPSRPVAMDPQMMVRRWYSIHGIHNYAPCDLQAAVNFLVEAHRRYPFESLVERTFPLAEVNEAIAHTLSTGAVRVGLRP
jgi:putative phosphonate catabolism associated alcohol dehydrogenase